MSVAVKYFLNYLSESAWSTVSGVIPGKVVLGEMKKKKQTEGDRKSNKINPFLPQVARKSKKINLFLLQVAVGKKVVS